MTLAALMTAPSFALPGVDGKTYALDDYAGTPALAVVFTCNHCPYAQAWEDRLLAIAGEYGGRGASFVAINSNDAATVPQDSFDEMKARAERVGYTMPYLHDEDQSVGRAYGAERTPEVFLFDAERRLVYHGAIDDSRDDLAVTRHYLRDALDATLAGGEPPLAETPPVGCTIKWRR